MEIPKLPTRNEISHKGDFGRLLIIAGSRGMIGAACLATKASLRTGCGLVHCAMPETSQKIAAATILSALTIPLLETVSGSVAKSAKKQIIDNLESKNAVAIGPGLTTNTKTVELICEILENEINVPTVVDADAINAISKNIQVLDKASKRFPMILTPHPGEMARLMSCTTAEIQNDRTSAVREFTSKYPDVTLV
ncbi:MAG: NAD(P)H-hydrate dehydratase, partial [Candidatus Heimdallarchaeota archaeon]|nr:NAD(P)H-hydrate dehydratase [Candidatus Heimdallarchaeota archaeon]